MDTKVWWASIVEFWNFFAFSFSASPCSISDSKYATSSFHFSYSSITPKSKKKLFLEEIIPSREVLEEEVRLRRGNRFVFWKQLRIQEKGRWRRRTHIGLRKFLDLDWYLETKGLETNLMFPILFPILLSHDFIFLLARWCLASSRWPYYISSLAKWRLYQVRHVVHPNHASECNMPEILHGGGHHFTESHPLFQCPRQYDLSHLEQDHDDLSTMFKLNRLDQALLQLHTHLDNLYWGFLIKHVTPIKAKTTLLCLKGTRMSGPMLLVASLVASTSSITLGTHPLA